MASPNLLLERAVKSWRLYDGSRGTVSMNTAARLYQRAMRLSRQVAATKRMDLDEACRQLSDEARRRGAIVPMPGKDY